MSEGGNTFERGTHFQSRSQLIIALKRWYEDTDEDTIGDLKFGRASWISFNTSAGLADLNADTRRAAVERMLKASERDPEPSWRVVENRRGQVNKVVFDENDTHEGWYAYLREALSSPTDIQ